MFSDFPNGICFMALGQLTWDITLRSSVSPWTAVIIGIAFSLKLFNYNFWIRGKYRAHLNKTNYGNGLGFTVQANKVNPMMPQNSIGLSPKSNAVPYELARKDFPMEYERANPVTTLEATKEWLDYLQKSRQAKSNGNIGPIKKVFSNLLEKKKNKKKMVSSTGGRSSIGGQSQCVGALKEYLGKQNNFQYLTAAIAGYANSNQVLGHHPMLANNIVAGRPKSRYQTHGGQVPRDLGVAVDFVNQVQELMANKNRFTAPDVRARRISSICSDFIEQNGSILNGCISPVKSKAPNSGRPLVFSSKNIQFISNDREKNVNPPRKNSSDVHGSSFSPNPKNPRRKIPSKSIYHIEPKMAKSLPQKLTQNRLLDIDERPKYELSYRSPGMSQSSLDIRAPGFENIQNLNPGPYPRRHKVLTPKDISLKYIAGVSLQSIAEIDDFSFNRSHPHSRPSQVGSF
jgi:hypothetical protein